MAGWGGSGNRVLGGSQLAGGLDPPPLPPVGVPLALRKVLRRAASQRDWVVREVNRTPGANGRRGLGDE